MGAFLAPIFVVIMINVIFFIWVILVIIRHVKETAERTKQTVTNKQILRIMFSISGVLFLFGITWGFFILTFSVSGLRETFQTLFTVFNSLQGFFVFAFILFTEGFGYWKALLSCEKHKSKSQASAPGMNNICTIKSSNTPNILPRQEKDTPEILHLNIKTTEINTNKKVELTSSSEVASTTELVSVDTAYSGNQVNDIMYPNDQEQYHIIINEQQDLQQEAGFKKQTDTKPLRILIKRYSTKIYKQHHVEEMKVEFFDEDNSSSDEDVLDTCSAK